MCTSTQSVAVTPETVVDRPGFDYADAGQGVLFHYRNMVSAIFVVLPPKCVDRPRFAVISTPSLAPLMAATRLRRGPTNSARGAGKLLADTLASVFHRG